MLAGNGPLDSEVLAASRDMLLNRERELEEDLIRTRRARVSLDELLAGGGSEAVVKGEPLDCDELKREKNHRSALVRVAERSGGRVHLNSAAQQLFECRDPRGKWLNFRSALHRWCRDSGLWELEGNGFFRWKGAAFGEAETAFGEAETASVQTRETESGQGGGKLGGVPDDIFEMRFF